MADQTRTLWIQCFIPSLSTAHPKGWYFPHERVGYQRYDELLTSIRPLPEPISTDGFKSGDRTDSWAKAPWDSKE